MHCVYWIRTVHTMCAREKKNIEISFRRVCFHNICFIQQKWHRYIYIIKKKTIKKYIPTSRQRRFLVRRGRNIFEPRRYFNPESEAIELKWRFFFLRFVPDLFEWILYERRRFEQRRDCSVSRRLGYESHGMKQQITRSHDTMTISRRSCDRIFAGRSKTNENETWKRVDVRKN